MIELENGNVIAPEEGELCRVAFLAKEISRTPLLDQHGKMLPYHITVNDSDKRMLAVKWNGVTYAPDELMVAYVFRGNLRPGLRLLSKCYIGNPLIMSPIKRILYPKVTKTLRPGDQFFDKTIKTVLTTLPGLGDHTVIYCTDWSTLSTPVGATVYASSCVSTGVSGIAANSVKEGMYARIGGKDYMVRAVYKDENLIEIRFANNPNAYFFKPSCPLMIVCRDQLNEPIRDEAVFMQIGDCVEGDEVLGQGVLKSGMLLSSSGGYSCKFSGTGKIYGSMSEYVWARPIEWSVYRTAPKKLDDEINKLLKRNFKDAPQLVDGVGEFALLRFPNCDAKIIMERQ